MSSTLTTEWVRSAVTQEMANVHQILWEGRMASVSIHSSIAGNDLWELSVNAGSARMGEVNYPRQRPNLSLRHCAWIF